MINRRYEKKNLGLLYSVGKVYIKSTKQPSKTKKISIFS